MTQVSRSRDVPEAYRTTIALFVVGVALASIDNIFYAIYRPQFSTGDHIDFFALVSFFLIVASAVAIAASAFIYLMIQRRVSVTEVDSAVHWPLGKVLSTALFEKRLMLFSTLVYAIFFAFLDGILVYQPNVDFAIAYAVNGPTWRVAMCCGPPGYVPVGLLYLPSLHAGMELIPLSLMLMILVSTLVGLNVTLLYESYNLSRTRPIGSSRGFFGSLAGAGLGLFAGCPTCAATFFLSMIAGTGSLAFAGLVSAYQPLIVAITVPLLLFSIIWQANSIKNLLRGCLPLTRDQDAQAQS